MLTEERIQQIWDKASGYIPGCERHIAYGRALEAEVMAEVCSAQNSEYAPQDCLSLTDATQVRMEAQEPVGCVLYYEIAPYRGVCGATVGADGGGEFADVFLGDPEACATAAREKVSEMERHGTKLKNASILCNGDIYSYSGSHVTVTSLAPQPPGHCPKCAEFALFPNVDALRQCMLSTADENDSLRSKFDLLVIENDAQAVLISDQQADVEKQTEISNNFAAQVRQQNETISSLRAEVDHRQSLLRESNRNCAEHAGVVWTQNVTIAQQAERIAELEAESLAFAEQNDNSIAEMGARLEAQTALIEKCEKALIYHVEMTRPLNSTDEALAAIVAQKGGV